MRVAATLLHVRMPTPKSKSKEAAVLTVIIVCLIPLFNFTSKVIAYLQ
jgi:hypothetical protein